VVERDVGSELEVLAAVVVGGLAVSAVHAVGEQQELVFVVYHVGVFRVALVHGCPVDGGEGGGVDADGHVLVGHGEGLSAEGACAGGVAVLVAEGCAGGGVAEGEAELVAAAVVEGLAALQSSAAVGGDAADGVLGRRAGEGDGLDGDVGVGGDGAGGLALGGAEGAGVVAVGRGDVAATIIVEGAAADVAVVLRGEEAVADGGGGVAVAYEAAASVGADYLAVEHAARDGDESADADAAGVAFAADVNAADTVGDGGLAGGLAHDAGGAVVGAADGAADDEVLDGGAVDVAERSRHHVVVVRVVDGEGLAAAVEGSREFMAAAARHARDGVLSRANVGAEADGLAAEAVVGVVVVEAVAEDVPACGGVDGVLVARLREVGGVGGEGGGYGDVGGGHGERAVGDGHVAALVAAEGIARANGVAEGDGSAAGVVGLAGQECAAVGGGGAGGDVVAEGQLIDALVAAAVGVSISCNAYAVRVVIDAVLDGLLAVAVPDNHSVLYRGADDRASLDSSGITAVRPHDAAGLSSTSTGDGTAQHGAVADGGSYQSGDASAA